MSVRSFSSRDGIRLGYREIGSGRPLILLHGFMGTGLHWLVRGPAASFAEHGFRVLLPDLRGHGLSAKPHDHRAYPPDVLAEDGMAFVDHLGLGAGDYDLGGYSLGARIVVRMLVRGSEPARAVVAAQGLAKISGPQRSEATRSALTAVLDRVDLDHDSAERQTAHRVSELAEDPQALLYMLDSLVATRGEDLRAIALPTLVVIGDRDERSDADELAALLPAGRFARVPGDHESAITAPEFAAAVKAFLGERVPLAGPG